MPVGRQNRFQNQTGQTNAPMRLHHIREVCHDYKWHILLSLLSISLVLGYIGFWKYTRAIGSPHSATDLLYKTIQLTTLESGSVSGPVSWELEVARLLVPVITAYTAVLAAAVLFRKQLQLLRLRYIRDHIVLCGLGEKGFLLASSLYQRGYDLVAIELDENNAYINICREMGMIVLERDAADPTSLRKAAVHHASHLVAVCGDDGVNAEVALLACQLAQTRKRGVLNCRIHIVNPQLYELLREHEFGTHAFPKFRLEMFNIFEHGARALLRDFPPVDIRSGLAQAEPHILVVGLSRLGANLVIQAARDWYDRTSGGAGKLRISLVDPDASERAALLNHRYPKISCCCELIPYTMNLDGLAFDEARFLFDPQTGCDLNIIYICLDDHTSGLQSALKLRQRLQHDQPPIIVRMDEDSGLARLLTEENVAGISNHILPFGLLRRVCSADLVLGGTHEILARALHEDYVRRRLEEGEKMGQRRSLVVWDQLPEDLRESNRRQADHIRLKLRTAGYGIQPLEDWEAMDYQFGAQEIETMAVKEHEHWMQERLKNGWRFAPGPENSAGKTHPDIVPWGELPELAREKDRQTVTQLPGLLAKAGFQIYRLNQLTLEE